LNTGRVCLRGIIIGGMTNLVGSMAMLVPVAIGAAMRIDLSALAPGERALAVAEALQRPGYQLPALLLGSLFSVVGGYVSARCAQRAEVMNGALASIPSMLLGVSPLLGGHVPLPLWQHLGLFALCPVVGALGGYLRLRQTAAS
jgi:hypothetical protein